MLKSSLKEQPPPDAIRPVNTKFNTLRTLQIASILSIFSAIGAFIFGIRGEIGLALVCGIVFFANCYMAYTIATINLEEENDRLATKLGHLERKFDSVLEASERSAMALETVNSELLTKGYSRGSTAVPASTGIGLTAHVGNNGTQSAAGEVKRISFGSFEEEQEKLDEYINEFETQPYFAQSATIYWILEDGIVAPTVRIPNSVSKTSTRSLGRFVNPVQGFQYCSRFFWKGPTQ